MTLLAPEALWWLLLALPLTVLHLRRERRRRLAVPSTRLWRELAGGVTGYRGWRRLREPLSLALLLLALACLAVALARPATGSLPPPGRSLVIVLDAGATMGAHDAAPGRTSRLAAARSAAESALGGLAPADDVTLWIAGERPRTVVSPTRDRGAVRAALAATPPTLAPRCLGAAVRAAQAALELRRTPGAVLVLTDPAGAASLPTDGDVVVDTVVGVVGDAATPNAGIRDVVAGPLGRLVVRVGATDGGVSERRVEARVDGVAVGSAALALPPGGEDDFLVEIPAGVRGVVTVHLVPGDAFDEDDRAAYVVVSRPPLRIVVTAPDGRVSPFLASALAAQGDLVDRAAALVASPDAPAELLAAADVVVAEGEVPAALPPDRPLLAFVEEGEVVLRPLLWGVGAHAVLTGVDLTPLRVDRAGVAPLCAGETALVESPSGVVGVVADGPPRRVRVRFRPEASTLPLESAFPLLVRNALEWLRPAPPVAGAVRCGAPLPLDDDLRTRPLELVVDGVRATHLGGGSAALPLAPRPAPGAGRALRLQAEDGALLGVLGLVWSLPPGERLGTAAAVPGLSASSAVAAATRTAAPPPPRREFAAEFGLAAAAFLALGALVLAVSTRGPHRSRVRGPPTPAPRNAGAASSPTARLAESTPPGGPSR